MFDPAVMYGLTILDLCILARLSKADDISAPEFFELVTVTVDTPVYRQRLANLQSLGFVSQTGRLQVNHTGPRSMVWRITEDGRQCLAYAVRIIVGSSASA